MNLIKATMMAAGVIVIAQTATAVNYNAANADLLLVFRKTSSKDMVFGVGSVSNYLAVAPGATIAVTGYNTNQVYTNYNNSFTGVNFILAADDNYSRVWLTDADLVTVPPTLTGGEYATLSGKIQGVGQAASTYTANNATKPHVVAASADSSYSYIVSEGTGANINSWNGNLNFNAEVVSGSTQKFYELKANGPGVTPPPAKLIGSFTMAANGVITFTAPGATVTLSPASITGVIRNGNASQISFTTTNDNNYRLLYTTSLTPPVTWMTNVAAGTVTGDNSVKTFNDSTADTQRLYRIQSY